MSTIKDALNRFITGVWFFPYLKQAKETDLPEPIGVTKSGKLVKLDPSSAVGPQGPEGPQGEQGPIGPQGIQGPAGTNGTNGTNATITSASATSLAEGAAPTVTLGGTASARTFTFGIPKGDKGDTGSQGIQGIQGATGQTGAKGDKGDPGDSIVPTPPATGTATLKSVDGVLSWVAE